MSYAQIAAEVGYANRGTVHSVVAQALASREAESVDLLRQVELDRLNDVHAALWPKAMAGDLDAVMALLRVIEARCRLLGLYGDGRPTESQAAGTVARGRLLSSFRRMTAGTKGVSDTGGSRSPYPRLAQASKGTDRPRRHQSAGRK